ncbi:MAG: hypothetical protein AAB581_02260 [Patescibacteria group bacterium]
MAKKILYLQPNENIAYLIHRLENVETDEVYLAADAYPEFFEDMVTVRLLKREAEFLKKKITVVSQHERVITAAQNAELDTRAGDALDLDESFRESTVAAEAAAQPSGGDVVSDEEVSVRVVTPGAADDRIEKMPPLGQTPKRSFGQPPLFAERRGEAARGAAQVVGPRRMRIFFVIVVVVLVAGGVGYYALAPRVTLNITPKKESVKFEFAVKADTKISAVDLENNAIPGQLVSVKKDVSDTFSASTRRSNDTKATGHITIYNEYGSAPQVLVKTTRLKTSDGKIFRLAQAVTVPGAKMENNKVVAPGTVTATVEADTAGAEYNIGPSDFSVPGFEGTPKFLGFYGKSSDAMTGGGAGSGFAASPEDLAKAKVALEEKIGTISDVYVKGNIPQGLEVLPDVPSDRDIQFVAEDPNADGTFRATLTVTVRVFAVAEQDVLALSEHVISSRAANDAEPSGLASRTLSYARAVRSQDAASVSFSATIDEQLVRVVDGSALKNDLAGKSESEIKDMLRGNDAIENVELIFRPFWISAAPRNPERITVNVNEG